MQMQDFQDSMYCLVWVGVGGGIVLPCCACAERVLSSARAWTVGCCKAVGLCEPQRAYRMRVSSMRQTLPTVLETTCT
jgi:hypothetical protein